MFEKRFYLTINEDIYISHTKNRALLYNTNNGDLIESNSLDIIEFISKINRISNLYCLEIEEKLFNNSNFKSFISEIKSKSMGKLVSTSEFPKRPIVMRPVLGLKKREDGKGVQFDNNQIMNYLRSITIFINNSCELNCEFCSTAYIQFPCCHSVQKNKSELHIADIKNIVDEVKYSSLSKLNIIGGNIFKYSKFDKLIECLSETNHNIDFFIHYNNITEIDKFKKIINIKNFKLNILVGPDFLLPKLNVLINNSKTKNKIVYNFIVDSNKSLEKIRFFITEKKINNYLIKPHLNQINIDFFIENIFLSKKKIFQTKQKMNDIYRRKILNNFKFGKLFINNDGDIYSSIATDSLGNIRNTMIREIIYNELNSGINWNIIRESVKPCNDCVYNCLCPSISSYEQIGMRDKHLKFPGCTILKENNNSNNIGGKYEF